MTNPSLVGSVSYWVGHNTLNDVCPYIYMHTGTLLL